MIHCAGIKPLPERCFETVIWPRVLFVFFVLTIGQFLAPLANSAIIVGEFGGIVTRTDFFVSPSRDPALFPGGGISVGDRLSAQLFYDTETALIASFNDSHGLFTFSAIPPSSAMSLTIGDFTWNADPLANSAPFAPPIRVSIQNDFSFFPSPVPVTSDTVDFFGRGGDSASFPVHQDLQNLHLSLRFLDTSAMLVENGALPTLISIDGLAVAPSSYLFNICSESNFFTDGYCIRGNLDFASLSEASEPSPIPEPSALALFATGLAALGVMSWRRRRALSGGPD